MEVGFIIWLVVIVVFWRWFVGIAVLAALSDYLEDYFRGRR